MRKITQAGFAHIFILLILLLGIIAGVYLTVTGNLKLFPKASVPVPTAPETSFTLVDANGSSCEGILCNIFTKTEVNGSIIKVDLYARSDFETANLFSAKINFPTDLLQVSTILTESCEKRPPACTGGGDCSPALLFPWTCPGDTRGNASVIKNWVENTFDNTAGTISLVGGVPNPGIQSQLGQPGLYIATIIFQAKKEGIATIYFTDTSAIYSNSNNINILTIKNNLDLEIAKLTSPAPDSGGFEIGLEAGAQSDTGMVDVVSESGAKWVRINFIIRCGGNENISYPACSWLNSQSDIDAYNQLINVYLQKGIKIYGLIGAESVKGPPNMSAYDRSNPGQFTDKFVDTADAIVARFGDRVKVFEIFNEPNDWACGDQTINCSNPQVPANYFAEYLAKVYQKIKVEKGRKDISLISGPLASFDYNSGDDYLSQAYQAGLKSDGVGYHIYVAQGENDQASVVPNLIENLDAIKEVIDQRDPGKKIWISEFGWGTRGGNVSERVQAENLTAAYNLFKKRSEVKMAMWFTIQDFGDPAEFGLRHGLGQGETVSLPKEAWCAFTQIAGGVACPGTASVTSPISGKGDGNNDGKPNLIDLSILLSDMNKNSGFRKGIDMNEDGIVNSPDFLLLRNLLIQKGVIKGQ